jgi:hypothetical protein
MGDKRMKKITDEICIGSRDDIFLNATIEDEKTVVNVTPRDNRYQLPLIKSYLNVAVDLNINNVKIPKIGLIDGKGNSKGILMRAVAATDALIKKHGNVMVFCQKGQSQSALVVLAYLYFKKGMAIEKAYNIIRFKKPDIKINPFLSLMLCELAGERYFQEGDSNPENPKLPEDKLVPEAGKIEPPKEKAKNAQPIKRGRPKRKK